MDIAAIVAWVTANSKDLILIVTSVVTIASIIVKLTPTPKDDAVLAKILKLFEFLSLNKR